MHFPLAVTVNTDLVLAVLDAKGATKPTADVSSLDSSHSPAAEHKPQLVGNHAAADAAAVAAFADANGAVVAAVANDDDVAEHTTAVVAPAPAQPVAAVVATVAAATAGYYCSDSPRRHWSLNSNCARRCDRLGFD